MATAAVVVGVIFTIVGLDSADKLASVLGLFTGIAGLAVAVCGLLPLHRSDGEPGSGGGARGDRDPGISNTIGGNAASAVQARDIFGAVHLNERTESGDAERGGP